MKLSKSLYKSELNRTISPPAHLIESTHQKVTQHQMMPTDPIASGADLEMIDFKWPEKEFLSTPVIVAVAVIAALTGLLIYFMGSQPGEDYPNVYEGVEPTYTEGYQMYEICDDELELGECETPPATTPSEVAHEGRYRLVIRPGQPDNDDNDE